MLRGVVRRFVTTRSPAFWLLTARVCRIAGRVSRNHSAWTARAGHALLLAGDDRAAGDAFLAAISGADSGDLAQVVKRVDHEGLTGDPPAGWYYSLGKCLHRHGDSQGAASLVRAACRQRPDQVRWLRLLAEIEEELDDVAASIAVRQRLVERTGDRDPRARFGLAGVHDRAGEWDVAQRVLVENLRDHPKHAQSYKLLADVATSIARWGGAFSGTVPERTAGAFTFMGVSTSTGPAAATSMSPVSALAELVALEPARPQWRALLADARLADGDVDRAVADYEDALRVAETTDDRWVLGAKQRLQFHLERGRHLLGNARVADPLFDVEITPAGDPATGLQRPAGFFTARLGYAGLTIPGFLGLADDDSVRILLNGTPVRAVNVSRESYLPAFTLLIKRTTLAQFPERARLEVRTAADEPLLGPRGVQYIDVAVPHGDGKLLEIIAAGGALDKKGEIRPSPAEMRRRQDRDLEIYARVREFFDSKLGRPLFLMYGTLLGHYRDGDLIPGDDDFDAGYVSDETDPVAVKEEAKEIIVELVRAGFTVSFNRRGRLFRVQLDRSESNNCHVDVHSLWFQDDKVWIHNVLSMPGAREDYLPVVENTLRGVPVSIPGRAEAFLRGNYGPGWVTPDPGFSYYPSAVEPSIRRNLARALMTAGEYTELAERIRREVGDDPTAGRFVSIGSQNLYPLSEFIA